MPPTNSPTSPARPAATRSASRSTRRRASISPRPSRGRTASSIASTGGVAGLLARAKVRVVEGWAKFQRRQDLHGRDRRTARSRSPPSTSSSPPAPSRSPLPILPFGGNVISSTEALSLPELPKQLVVVGAGYIGLELGIAFRKLGAAVTIVEAADRILPRYDEALTRPVRALAGRATGVDAASRRQASTGRRRRRPPRGRNRQRPRSRSTPTRSSSRSAAGR